jgi:hypothetical protein
MRTRRSLGVAVLAALLSVPCLAAIKAMTLGELMQATTDVVHAQILARSTFHAASPFTGDDAVWTRLSLSGESMTSGDPVAFDVVFLGSHDPADAYAISEMPTLQDTRVGNEVVLFYHLHAGDHSSEASNERVVHNLAEVFRVEQGFGQAVVLGRGQGSAFPENVKLEEARKLVRLAAAELKAAGARPAGAEGK